MPIVSVSRLAIPLLFVGACAQTVDGRVPDAAVGADADAASHADIGLPDGYRECPVSDWRCSDRIDPIGQVVWVDQDLDFLSVILAYWESNRIRYGVRLSPYRIGRYEMTNEAYRACATAGACPSPRAPPFVGAPRLYPDDYATSNAYRYYPAVLNWFRARAACRFLGGDLPTKAQWQFAADAGRDQMFPWGNDFQCLGNFDAVLNVVDSEDLQRRADCGRNVRVPRTLPVDSSPNGRGPFGSYNLQGNVGEFIFNDYAADPSAASVRQQNNAGVFPLDPAPTVSEYGMSVGGSWSYVVPFRYNANFVSARLDAPISWYSGVRCVWPDS